MIQTFYRIDHDTPIKNKTMIVLNTMTSTCQTVFSNMKRLVSTLNSQVDFRKAIICTLITSSLGVTTFANAAELTILDSVIVKFGQDAELVARDKLKLGKNTTFTSSKDDLAGGPLSATAQIPAAANWRGIRVEKSSAPSSPQLGEGTMIRYAGALNGAGLTLRGVTSALNAFQLTDNVVGLRLQQAASSNISTSSFLRNGTGLEASENAVPVITNSQFVQNSANAAFNFMPANVIQATGNWWGHSSGPKQTSTNPQGLGDSISSGFNFSNYLVTAPLLNPTVQLATPAPYFEQHTIALNLSCLNATEYRIAEGNAFANVPFQSLADGHGKVIFTTTAGDGIKNVNVQFRNATGAIVTANLAGGVLIDGQVPIVSLTNPSSGSVISQAIVLEATANDGAGIASLSFYIDDQLVATRSSLPYSYKWDATVDGVHTIKVIALDIAGRTSEQSAQVTVVHTPQAPDIAGPEITNVNVNGAALGNGTVFARNSTLTFAAADRSGIARIELFLDAVSLGVASGSGNYTIPFNLDGVTNGAHVLVIRGSDSLGNISTLTYNISVAHAVPNAPIFSQPQNGLTTRTAVLAISGSAQAGGTLQLQVNGLPVGGSFIVAANGQFSSSLTLTSGANLIQATVADQYGTSAVSGSVLVTLDTTVPASPGTLNALAQPAGKVRLTWARSTDVNTLGYDVYRSPTIFNVITEAVKINNALLTSTAYDDLPPQDLTWNYRVVAVNSAGTPSVPTNLAQAISDGTVPKAVSIIYTPLGKTDAGTGRIGQGWVNLILTTSEALQVTPYLSIVPEGGAPIAVELTKTANTTYTGSFLIDANTPSGIANALFSARDAVGNRGTDVGLGATLKIDTAGPNMVGIVLNPSAPIKNDQAQTIQVSFSFSKAPASIPQVKYLLSGPVRSAVALASLTQINPTNYKASFTLPADAGLANPESLSFSFQAKDDLDNMSSKVVAFNRFQIYQGNLPPLNIPFAFVAKAQAGGKVKLSWQAVDDASTYQLYRQAPGQTELQALVRANGIEYVDQTAQDGAYKYAIASVRQSNGQESVSGQSAVVDVVASATAPGAPQNLALQLTGQGIYATWQPPLSSTVDYYNLYRATGTSISSIANLTALKTRIKNPVTYDTSPSPTQGAYVVTAVDAAGNESAISNSAYLNASLLPVRNLKVEQLGTDLPVISWDAPNGNVAGYTVYVGPDNGKTKLTVNPISATSLTDSGYTVGERRYTVATVDANAVEMARSISLPNVAVQIVSGLPIKRGVMNKLQVQVSNTSASNLDGVKVVLRLPINKEANQFKDHKSEAFTLGANQTRLVAVIVGGYSDLAAAPQVQTGVEIAPNEGELVKIARNQTVDVTEGALVVGMATDEFTRGGSGKLKLTIENTSEVDIELLTATNNGADASSELRFKILDNDGNVLATQAYKQVFGANVVTLTNGQTVARIPAGSNYVSDVFNLNVPGSAGNSIRVKLEVDKLRYHSAQLDEVQITGRGSDKTVSLLDTAYVGELTNVAPLSSFGDQDVLITGRAVDRTSKALMPNTRLKLILNQQGFERSISVLTDTSGNFVYTFKPTVTDAGLYKVSAVHPEITDRPEQKAFTINRVTVSPTPYKLDVPKNYPFSIPFTAKAGPGTAASNLRYSFDAASQTTGQLPAGISLQLPAPVSLAERQMLNVPVIFTANNEAQASGSLILNVISDEHAGSPIGQVKVDYTLSEAKPFLVSTPSFVETGMAQAATQIESVTIKNSGLEDAQNLQFSLSKSDGNAAPNWASIASQANGTLAIGASRSIDLSFAPQANTPEGVYPLKLNVSGDNITSHAIDVYVSISQSGKGNLQFKAADIYTATIGKDGKQILGLANARVTVQNEDVATITQELTTDTLGEALFQNLPAGRYKFRATAANHQEVAGRLLVKPGITANQALFLNYNLINVEWSVREITIQDRYEITLNATYETDVPAAVVVMQPASVNLPKMNVGDVYYGELTLTNFGLVRANHVKQQLPVSDGRYRYEFLVEVPSELNAKQRVTIPYRVVSLQSLEAAASSGNASGGGCDNYSNKMSVSCDFPCANGNVSTCGSSTSWFSVSQSSCNSPGGGAGGGDAGGFSGGIWKYTPGPVATPIKKKGTKCVYVPKGGGSPCPE